MVSSNHIVWWCEQLSPAVNDIVLPRGVVVARAALGALRHGGHDYYMKYIYIIINNIIILYHVQLCTTLNKKTRLFLRLTFKHCGMVGWHTCILQSQAKKSQHWHRAKQCAWQYIYCISVYKFGVHLIWTEELRGSGVKEGEAELAWPREAASHLVVQWSFSV